MSDTILDISPKVHPGIGVWPGDVPYSFAYSLDMSQGDHLTLGSMKTTFHVGAHADAPNHYRRGGQSIGERSLYYYYGPCQVLAVDLEPGERIHSHHLTQPIERPRVLFKTRSFPDPDEFTDDFNSLSESLVDELAKHGVLLVGIDTPSIDPFADKVLESHQAVARYDMAVLEGLILDAVHPGHYTLMALPLRLTGADASPVRAALIPENASE